MNLHRSQLVCGGFSFGSEYDALGQLVRVNDPHENATWVYTYDCGGNILSKNRYAYTTGAVGTAEETIPYSYGDANWKDKLTNFNGNNISYDAIGNPLSDGIWTYTWEKGRQLKKIEREDTCVTFKYDHNGMRTQKVVQQDWYPVTSNYTWHGKLLTHMTVDYHDWDEVAQQDVLHFYYDAQKRPAKVKFNGTIYTYIHNLQGDIVGILDSTGVLVVEYKYDAWGKPLSTTGSMADTLGERNPFRYRGYVYDEETELYHLHTRYFRPQCSRFINLDMVLGGIGALNSHNLYAYCINNPVDKKDSAGLFWETVYDVATLGTSICEVCINPGDPWAWAGLAGDALDLIPFVSCLGEGVRAYKITVNVADGAVDVVSDARKSYSAMKRLSGSEALTKAIGSYEIRFANGKQYVGKGGFYRATTSAKYRAGKMETDVVSIEWRSSPNEQWAFIDEFARQFMGGFGTEETNLINAIWSPGRKLFDALKSN